MIFFGGGGDLCHIFGVGVRKKKIGAVPKAMFFLDVSDSIFTTMGDALSDTC